MINSWDIRTLWDFIGTLCGGRSFSCTSRMFKIPFWSWYSPVSLQHLSVENIRPDYASAIEMFHLDSPTSVQLYQVDILIFFIFFLLHMAISTVISYKYNYIKYYFLLSNIGSPSWSEPRWCGRASGYASVCFETGHRRSCVLWWYSSLWEWALFGSCHQH